MKRVVEKVKDIVEICPFTHLHDFAADPGLTLAGYHFTDITADLMSKWIDRAAGVRTGQGAAMALAGFRGVGKSHFIAVLGVVVSHPELRSRISDQHVASSAERLSRRHGPIVFVRRGSGISLLDELKRAIGLFLTVNPSTLSDSLYDLLLRASEHAGDLPLIVLIDTALGRDSRVARDDGFLLSEIADAAKALGIFVGVALDDDISGADGPNASISGNYNIDYLDQEHLYKIVDSHIFSKYNQMRPMLHDIYEDYRTSLPGFRWSEQRFTSLYPLHPATVEIAPLIRLYIHDFALLGFAAEAGVKILGRPANSLIGIDEVFDSVESKLRAVTDLSEAFVAFEKLEREVISRTPVHLRHPAKLILKGLLILSLNGEGATAPEIAASMMICAGETSDPQTLDIESLLNSFAEALPNAVEKLVRNGLTTKYCFKLTSRLDFDALLAEAVKQVSDEVIWSTLIEQTSEKYADINLESLNVEDRTSCSVEWRGSIRRGELVWPPTEDTSPAQEGQEKPDWIIRVEPDRGGSYPPEENGAIVWKLDKLADDEKDLIRRHHLLQTDAKVREQFGEGLSTAMHVHSIAIDKIWQRVFLLDGSLTAGDSSYKFTEGAMSAHTLAGLLTTTLAPIFEARYPTHPQFHGSLGYKQSANLISSFFGGSDTTNADAQKLAASFAYPLGLAVKQGDTLSSASADELYELEIVRAAVGGSDSSDTIPLTDISGRLASEPFGLTREAQQVIVAALVAQRQFEFVTSSGNRINQRSLDLQIVWDDIVGIAKPLNEVYSPERLLLWARLITGNFGLKSLDRTEDRLLVIDSLAGWLTGWKQSRTIDEFDALSDENLSAAIWRIAANLRKSFGAMADTIDSLIKNDVSLDQCIQLIADLFSDSEVEFEKKKSDLRTLRNFTAGVSKRSEIIGYLTLCEITDNQDLEILRRTLLESVHSGQLTMTGPGADQVEVFWKNFREMYSNHYVEMHDSVMKSASSSEKLREIIRSNEWSTFESFASISWLDQTYFVKAKTLIREIRQMACDANVREMLSSKPFCACSFSLIETQRLIDLPDRLLITVTSGLESFIAKFVENSASLIATTDSDAMCTSIKTILAGFTSPRVFPQLTTQDIRLLKIAAERLSEKNRPETAKSDLEEDFVHRIPDDMHLWEHEVEHLESFVNTEI